ncbi:putative ABC transporter ATP-binding protein YbhF [Anatilimnocola aggregata]|uniref:Putative ABC transporter ATP-binding protein YbhF n=1 Tax=Anatilimnocola aggregata TaxID=2528021 RepID=A0A517Y7E0_9BACT|nr:ABC transporter ATP-binding protein [Anatilimnocola aggregata]QDU26115.1 putative ABC transporter ATP-binding protein YbhF [Anatilimnocola aggregata]
MTHAPLPEIPAVKPFVETHELTKIYGPLRALDGCTLSVGKGEVFGLLGPNGAGKTTLLRLLLGFLQPSAGHATIAGLDCRRQSVAVRRQVAYLPAEAALFPQMRGREVLRFFAEIRGNTIDASLTIAERLELDLKRSVGFMSTGMKQKLALAATLGADVPMYILDEPTANLDPSVRSSVLALVAEARDRGATVMFSSHVLAEVEEVCQRVVILRSGQLVHTQVLQELRSQHRILAWLNGPLPPVPHELSRDDCRVSQQGDLATIESDGDLQPLLGWLASLPLRDIRIEPVGLRTIYERFHRSEPATAITPSPEASDAHKPLEYEALR